MNIQYKGINQKGRSEWVDLDLKSRHYPEGEPIEEWQLNVYRSFVETIENCIGRKLTKGELSSVLWLSGFEKITVDRFKAIIQQAYLHGKTSN